MWGLGEMTTVYVLATLCVGAAIIVAGALIGIMARSRLRRSREAAGRDAAPLVIAEQVRIAALPARVRTREGREALVDAVALAAPELPAITRARLAGWFREEGEVAAALAGLKAERPWARSVAVARLGRMGAREAALPVARLLGDASPDVRASAAVATGRLNETEGVPVIAAALRDGRLSDRVALAGLLRTGPTAGARIAGLLHDASADVRATAVSVLARRGDVDQAAAALAIARDPEKVVRQHVLLCLTAIGGNLPHDDLRAVIARGARDPSARVRSAAAAAAPILLFPDEAWRLLQNLVDDDDFWVGMRAARSLAGLGTRNGARHAGFELSLTGAGASARMLRESLAEPAHERGARAALALMQEEGS